MMQNIRPKQAEEKWSLQQHNFLAGSRKTVPLVCRSEDWIKLSMQNIRRLPPVVKATVRIFSTRNDLPLSPSFHTACWAPKIVFSATSSVLNDNDMLQLPNLAILLSLRYEWRLRIQHKQLLEKHSHQVLQLLIRHIWIHFHRTLDVYWPVRKMPVAHSESLNCKQLVEKLRCWFECSVNVKPINGGKSCKLFFQENVTIVYSESLTSKFCRTC